MKTTKADKALDIIWELQNAAANIDSLNNGGCGVFAAAAAKRLNRMGFKAYVRVASFSNYGLELARLITQRAIKSKDDLARNGIDCDHLIVEVVVGKRKFFFDSKACSEVFESKLFLNTQLGKGRMDPLSALRVARTRHGWNWRFCRSQIPTLLKQMNRAVANVA